LVSLTSTKDHLKRAFSNTSDWYVKAILSTQYYGSLPPRNNNNNNDNNKKNYLSKGYDVKQRIEECYVSEN